MFRLHIPSLARGAIHTSLIAIAAATIGAVVSATVTHNVTISQASASHEITPIDPTCTSSLPCIEYDNNGTGPGIRGISVSGNGIAGETGFKSTSAANARAGIAGVDVSVSGSFNSGVKGTSTRGFGVSGVSNSSSFPGAGVAGLLGSPSGVVAFASGAVYGDSKNGSGVLATSANAAAVVAASSNSFGVDGITFNKSSTTGHSLSGVLGNDASSDGGHLNAGVSGLSTNGIGVVAQSTNFVGANVVGGLHTSALPALSVVGNDGADLIDACPSGTDNPCDQTVSVFQLDTAGNIFVNGGLIAIGGFRAIGNGLIEQALAVGSASTPPGGSVNISGQYQKDGACILGCSAATPASAGRAVTTYASMVSQPTVEDFGEAQLVSGQTYVNLDPKFANVVDQRSNYLVFITPKGDNRGLHVTNETSSGFTVRESQGGRSTLAFDYRIVAKPFGSHEARLPMIELPRSRAVGRPLKRASKPADGQN